MSRQTFDAAAAAEPAAAVAEPAAAVAAAVAAADAGGTSARASVGPLLLHAQTGSAFSEADFECARAFTFGRDASHLTMIRP